MLIQVHLGGQLQGSRREKLSNTPVESIAGTTNASGLNPVRASGRYVRANVKVSAGTDWNHAQGIDIIAGEAGTR